MDMKQNKFLAVLFVAFTTIFLQLDMQAQEEKQDNFIKMRNTDFTKLIGGIQEGFRLDYNTEKTSLGGSVAKEYKKSGLMFQLVGSVGTTTNLSSLFDQKVLPTMSGSLTLHYPMKWASTWFYDGSFSKNFNSIQNPATKLEDISTDVVENGVTYVGNFEYREALREKIRTNKLSSTDRFYTHKRFLWLSATGKYENNKYLFFNSALPFASQFSEPTFAAWTGKVAANYFVSWNKTDLKWKGGFFGWRPNFFYITGGLQYGLGNNVTQLKKQTVHDVSSSVVSGGTTREVVKTQTPYAGQFKEFKMLTPSFDIILSPIRSFAINVFGDRTLISSSDRDKMGLSNYGTIATGVYFYGNGSTSKINIGVFYKWTTNNTTNETVGNFGLRTAIPITPVE